MRSISPASLIACGTLLFLAGAPEDLAEDAHPGFGFGVVRSERLDEGADRRLLCVGREAAGVLGNVHDVEQKLGEAFAVFGGGWRGDVAWDFLCAFETAAGELVEADRDGLAEVHGEVTGAFRREHGDGGEPGAVTELLVGQTGLFGAEE